MSDLKSIRAALLGAKVEFASKEVTVCGIKVEVRQPSVKSRRDLFKRATIDGVMDSSEFMVWAVIYNTYVPNTEERVFEDTDYEALVERPVGGFMDQISESAAEMMNVEEGVEAKVKN